MSWNNYALEGWTEKNLTSVLWKDFVRLKNSALTWPLWRKYYAFTHEEWLSGLYVSCLGLTFVFMLSYITQSRFVTNSQSSESQCGCCLSFWLFLHAAALGPHFLVTFSYKWAFFTIKQLSSSVVMYFYIMFSFASKSQVSQPTRTWEYIM